MFGVVFKRYLFILLSAFVFSSKLVGAGESPLRNFRFVEAKIIKEVAALPPRLELTIEVICNEEFVKVIRHEYVEPKSKKVILALGAVVREDPFSSCAGEKREMKVDAGTTFSGRDYEVTRIRK